MRVVRLGGHEIGITDVNRLVEKNYGWDPVDLDRLPWAGLAPVRKGLNDQKQVAAPYSMSKLLKILEVDEYHSGCVDAITMCSIMQVRCADARVNDWLQNAEYPGNDDIASILSELVKYYAACGNGFLLKMRNAQDEWVGLERLLPNEAYILENYDGFGFFRPDFIQVRNNKRTWFPGSDVIHFKRATHKSNAWGLSSLPVAANVEIMKEIKTFDYNNFKNGLMIDYFLIVEGGTLREQALDPLEDETTDAYSEIERALRAAKGNDQSHGTILIESENPQVKIRLEPIRQAAPEGGFIQLKKDLREGVFAYHRVPPRVVSQTIPGALGGDYANDMKLFASFVIQPLQRRIASVMAREFNREFGWDVKPEHFDFGNPADVFASPSDLIFRENMRPIQTTEVRE